MRTWSTPVSVSTLATVPRGLRRLIVLLACRPLFVGADEHRDAGRTHERQVGQVDDKVRRIGEVGQARPQGRGRTQVELAGQSDDVVGPVHEHRNAEVVIFGRRHLGLLHEV